MSLQLFSIIQLVFFAHMKIVIQKSYIGLVTSSIIFLFQVFLLFATNIFLVMFTMSLRITITIECVIIKKPYRTVLYTTTLHVNVVETHKITYVEQVINLPPFGVWSPPSLDSYFCWMEIILSMLMGRGLILNMGSLVRIKGHHIVNCLIIILHGQLNDNCL
jgi:hypothetical protein